MGFILVLVGACSHPLRLDPHWQQLQEQQRQCLERGGNPQQCRP
jgi:hypothetical protein